MVLGAIVANSKTEHGAAELTMLTTELTEKFERGLLPYTADKCWGRGVSFGMALQKAQDIIEDLK